MKKRRAIIGLIVIFVIFISLLAIQFYLDRKDVTPAEIVDPKLKCDVDSDCVVDSCCHATSCVNKDNSPKCEGMFCTMNCEPDTLDCGQGSCKCLNNKCSTVFGG